jgi:hypothetical protein
MRRVLKVIATQCEIGNVMTLVNPEVVEHLIEDRKKIGEINFLSCNEVSVKFQNRNGKNEGFPEFRS